MVTSINTKYVLLSLFRDLYVIHTITSLAKKLKMSRVGIWKILKKLQSEDYIKLNSVGEGKTNAYIINLNWENIVIEKLLVTYLTEEAVKQIRWRKNFKDLEKEVDFLILYGSILYSKQAKDIDLIIVCRKNKFIKIQSIVNGIQKIQLKKIHNLNFTEIEFKEELKKKPFMDAIGKGVVLFGQDKFVKFLEGVKNG